MVEVTGDSADDAESAVNMVLAAVSCTGPDTADGATPKVRHHIACSGAAAYSVRFYDLVQRAAARRAAAAAKFHRDVIMPHPTLLAAVVGRKAETVTRISETARVSIVINYKKGWREGS